MMVLREAECEATLFL